MAEKYMTAQYIKMDMAERSQSYARQTELSSP